VGLIETVLQYLFPPAPEPLGAVRRGAGRPFVVRGRVVPRDQIQSPLTERRCVYYRYLVEEWRRTSIDLPGGGQGLWHAVEADEAIAEFYIDDGTGRAVVEPQAAHVAFTSPCGPEPVSMPSGRRASELRIEAGDWVEVQGVLAEIDDLLDGERGYREVAMRLALRAVEGGRIRIRLLRRG